MQRLILFMAGITILGAQEQPLFPLDPVALVEGTKVQGAEAHQATFDSYAYRFKDAASLARFRAQPDRYAIQLGAPARAWGSSAERGGPICMPCTAADVTSSLPRVAAPPS